LSDRLGAVFAALADPTRREMVNRLLSEGTTSVPELSATLPISRQAVAKHLATLDHAGLVERTASGGTHRGAPRGARPSGHTHGGAAIGARAGRQAGGREVRYRLRPGALSDASAWLAEADAAWERRLRRLKRTVERPSG